MGLWTSPVPLDAAEALLEKAVEAESKNEKNMKAMKSGKKRKRQEDARQEEEEEGGRRWPR